MRVLFTIESGADAEMSPYAERYVGGVEIDVRNLAEGFARRGHYVHFACVSSDSVVLSPNGVVVEHIPPSRLAFAPVVGALLRTRRFRASLRRIIRENGIQVVNSHLLYPASIVATEAALPTRTPVVVTLSSEEDIAELDSRRHEWYFPLDLFGLRAHRIVRARRAIVRASRIVCISPHLDQVLRKHVGKTQSPTSSITPGIDLRRFSAAQRSNRVLEGQRKYVFGCVSRLSVPKRIDLVLEAVAASGMANQVQVRIAGDGPLRQDLARLAKRLRLDVQFHGLVPNAEVPGFLADIDVFVFASDSEGLPKVVTEAFACGCRIIASRIPATAVFGGLPGCVLAPNSIAEFAHAMQEATRADPALQAERDLRGFDIERTVDQYEQLFERLCAEQPAHATGK